MKKTLIIISFIYLSLYITIHQIATKTPTKNNIDQDALLILTSGNQKSQNEQPNYQLLYDTLLTTLDPSIQKEIINFYGYPKQYGLYDAKILSLIRNEGQFGFLAKIQVTTFEHAHDPPYGKETITFQIDPAGIKPTNFQHEGEQLEKDIKKFYEATLSDIKQSFQLNLESYASYTYNQLQYQAEITHEFTSLFNIVEEIATNVLFPERKIPNKNIMNPVTFIKDNNGYILFKMSDGMNVNYEVAMEDDNWKVTRKSSKEGKKMEDEIPWYVSKNVRILINWVDIS